MNYDRLVRSSRLAMEAIGKTEFIADRSIRIARPDRERLVGKVKGGRGGSSVGAGRMQKLATKLAKKFEIKPPRASKRGKPGKRGRVTWEKPTHTDWRQRAVAKIHYFPHADGGGASLKAHAKYVARDAATVRDGPPIEEETPTRRKLAAHAHADYLERDARGVFYDADGAGIDGAARTEKWAKSDLRHFRIILSAEEGARLKDLPAYTREVMARAGAALGTKLSWVAVDHHDTDNPHTHLIVRGRRANGQDLVLPRDFIKHGFRNLARDVATEWLGKRTPEQEREALTRETRRHGPTRLDGMIASQAPEGRVRSAELTAPNGDPSLEQALKARVLELERLGLAIELDRGLFQLAHDWRDRLKSMELHLDIRKRVERDRAERNVAQQRIQSLGKGPIDR